MCRLRDIRAIRQQSDKYDGKDLVWVQLEMFTVDDEGRSEGLGTIEEFDVALRDFTPDAEVPDYCCLACETDLHFWADVIAHIDDFEDDDDGGVSDQPPSWLPAFGL